jgi:thymidylate synthase (FAD)
MIEVKYINHMGDDLTVVNAARVSFNKVSELECIDMQKGKYAMKHDDEKLIKYLAKHKHISPFGHCFASFHVKAPVFVARQLVKHKFLRWNEISRRYVDEEPEIYEPEVWRGRSKDKKQGSYGDITDYAMNFVWWDDYKLGEQIEFYNKGVVAMYKRMIEVGIAPEQARMVLPQSMMTEWYWSGSLDAFADMCALRCKPDTQYESQLVANQIDEMMSEKFPVSWEALRMYAE